VTPNHVSWLDILTIGSVMPLSFVAKAEVARWPLFGLFARLQRSVFVDRARRSDTGRVTGEMASRLAGGEAIVLFPEGTSSNGTHVLPFRSSLLGAARAALADAGAPVLVQPLAISVTHIDGLPAGRAERPRVAWYGDMEMLPHLLGVIASGPIDIELRWGEPVAFEAKTDRKALARRLEGEVRRLMTAARGGPSAGPHG
jgi:1-acyl-sn-glycerol-3-phosphate acyltransferase